MQTARGEAGRGARSGEKKQPLQKRALKDGQLLKDLAWARLHLRVVDVWLQVANGAERGWLDSYERTLMAFPVPLTM